MDKLQLPNEAKYFPLQNGLYEVAPGLKVFGTDFGNGAADRCIFQIDADFPKYQQNKQRCREEGIGKYYCADRFEPETKKAIVQFLAKRLTEEHPGYFQWSTAGTQVDCALSGDKIPLDLGTAKTSTESSTRYTDAFDGLCSQVQEDLAVWQCSRGPDGKITAEWLAALHLCSPNHWAASEKVGRSFSAVHQPVAGFEKMHRSALSLVDAMITRGPYVRFAWGIATDDRLNHHPQPPIHISSAEWHGRSFDPHNPKLFLRIERQTLTPFPEVNASLFTIRTYFEDCAELKKDPQKREKLKAAILSMTPDSLSYKGLSENHQEILNWLAGDS